MAVVAEEDVLPPVFVRYAGEINREKVRDT